MAPKISQKSTEITIKQIEQMLKKETKNGCICKVEDCQGPSYRGQKLRISDEKMKRITAKNMKLLICENALNIVKNIHRDTAGVSEIKYLKGVKIVGNKICVEAVFHSTVERISLLNGCKDLIHIRLGLKKKGTPIKKVDEPGPREDWIEKILKGYWYVNPNGSVLELYLGKWWECTLSRDKFDTYAAQDDMYNAMIKLYDDEVERHNNIPKDEDKPKQGRRCLSSSRVSKPVASVSSSRSKSLKPKGRVGKSRKIEKSNENALSSESSFSPSIPKVWDDDDTEEDTKNVNKKEEKENIEQKVSTTQIDEGQGEVEQTVPTPKVDVVYIDLESPNSISDNATNSALNPVQVDREKSVPTAVVKPLVPQSTIFSINEVGISSCGTSTKPPEAENNSQMINVDPLNNASNNENNENEEIDIDIEAYQNVLEGLPIPSLINRCKTQQEQLYISSKPRISKPNLNQTSASMPAMVQTEAFCANTQSVPSPANVTLPKINIFADKITEVNYMHYPVGVSTQMFEPSPSDGPQYQVPNMVVTNMASPRTMSESVVAGPLKQMERMTKSQQQASEQIKFARYNQFVGNMDQENSLAFPVSNQANHSEFNTNYGVRNHAQNWQTGNTTHNGANCTNSNYHQLNGNMNNHNLFTKSMASMGNSLSHDRGAFYQTNHAVLSQAANTPNGANDQKVNSNQAYNWEPTITSTASASNFTGNNQQMNFVMAVPMPTTLNNNRSMDVPKKDPVNFSPTYNIFMNGSNNTQVTGPNSFNGHSSMQNQSEQPHQQQNKQPTWNNFTQNFAPIQNPQQNPNYTPSQLSKPIQSNLGMSSYSNCCPNSEMNSGSTFIPQTLTADNPMEYNSFTSSMASMDPQYLNGTIHNNRMQVRVNCAYYGCPKSCDDPKPYDPYSSTVANPKRILVNEQPMILNNHYRSTYQNNPNESGPQNIVFGPTQRNNARQMQYNTQPSSQSRQFAASCHQLEESHQPKRQKIQNRQNGTNSIPMKSSQFPGVTGTQEMFPRTGGQSVLSNQQFQTNMFNTAAYGNSYGNSSGISQNTYQGDVPNFNYSQMNQSSFK